MAPKRLRPEWGWLARVFKTSAFNRSATCPSGATPDVSAPTDRNVTVSGGAGQSHSVAISRKSSHLPTTDSTTSSYIPPSRQDRPAAPTAYALSMVRL